MEKQETIATQAYNILKDIPNKLWTVGSFCNGLKCCSLGHINRTVNKVEIADYGKPTTLYSNFRSSTLGVDIEEASKKFGVNIVSVNDNTSTILDSKKVFNKYTKLKTPKGRIIALLRDMIKAGL